VERPPAAVCSTSGKREEHSEAADKQQQLTKAIDGLALGTQGHLWPWGGIVNMLTSMPATNEASWATVLNANDMLDVWTT